MTRFNYEDIQLVKPEIERRIRCKAYREVVEKMAQLREVPNLEPAEAWGRLSSWVTVASMVGAVDEEI